MGEDKKLKELGTTNPPVTDGKTKRRRTGIEKYRVQVRRNAGDRALEKREGWPEGGGLTVHMINPALSKKRKKY